MPAKALNLKAPPNTPVAEREREKLPSSKMRFSLWNNQRIKENCKGNDIPTVIPCYLILHCAPLKTI